PAAVARTVISGAIFTPSSTTYVRKAENIKQCLANHRQCAQGAITGHFGRGFVQSLIAAYANAVEVGIGTFARPVSCDFPAVSRLAQID
ncbi:hypothetical protein CPC08DRAFT_712804, partial [Agrocybe pediades]